MNGFSLFFSYQKVYCLEEFGIISFSKHICKGVHVVGWNVNFIVDLTNDILLYHFVSKLVEPILMINHIGST